MKHGMTGLISALALGAALVQSSQAADQAAKPAAVASLADLKSQLTQLQNDVMATAATLQKVKEAAKNQDALGKAAAEFKSSFTTLEAQMDKVRKQAVVVKARSKDAYETWQKELAEIQSSSIRGKAQDRFTESKKQFDRIIEEAGKAKEETLPFVSAMKDVVLYLDADLSDEAVNSLSSTIWKLGNQSKSVKSSIGDVKDQIERTLKGMPQK